MKRKFRALLTFLKPYKEEVKFYWRNYDGNTEWDWTMCDKKEIPDSVKNIALEITESLENEIIDNLFDECYSETDYYLLFLIVDSVKKTATIKLETEHMVSQPETYENQLNNPELEEYFKRTGVEIIEARYSGGGDSGDIDRIKIDGEDSNIQWSSNDESERLIWNTLYDNLENAYGGWEIDDGSAGTIELNNNQEIVISHEWSIREMDLCDEQIEITMDMLED
jgi:hypothetical protein